MNYLTLFILAIFGAFLVGYGFGTIREQSKCLREINALKKQYRDANDAWGEHCKALRENYQNALLEERKKHGKCFHTEKVMYQGKYEVDPCAYVIKEKYRNVTIEISVCKKCGHTDVSWIRQEDTEEVEVE